MSFALAEDRKEEARFLGLLHSLQFVETSEDLRRLIPNCPEAKADAGEDNTEIVVKTKLFGFDAVGEFNFHKGILVSHGFEVLTGNYKDAHRVFLEAVAILDSQVNGLKLSATLPIALDGADSTDGPNDEITINVEGIDKKASFQLRLDMREDSVVVRWGAQKIANR
jgi:hypothetical protein